MLHADTAVGKHWCIKSKIGSGSFGEIFVGIDKRSKEKVAIKVESAQTNYPQLFEEWKVYRSLQGATGVPKVFWYGSISGGTSNALVMELLGDSLEALFNTCGRRFSLKTVCMLAIQLLHRIEHQHNMHWLHRDIKPDNFLMGTNENSNILYIIDMGLCKQYRDSSTLEHIPYKENKKLIGTPRYASLNTHLGIEQGRRDDLESIGYMLLYFTLGKLPWQGLKARTKQEKYDKISSKKSNTTPEKLCLGAPAEFLSYLQYCRNLVFVERPDYAYLRSLFEGIMASHQLVHDDKYDWDVLAMQKQAHKQVQEQVTNCVLPLPTYHMPPLPPQPAPAQMSMQRVCTLMYGSNTSQQFGLDLNNYAQPHNGVSQSLLHSPYAMPIAPGVYAPPQYGQHQLMSPPSPNQFLYMHALSSSQQQPVIYPGQAQSSTLPQHQQQTTFDYPLLQMSSSTASQLDHRAHSRNTPIPNNSYELPDSACNGLTTQIKGENTLQNMPAQQQQSSSMHAMAPPAPKNWNTTTALPSGNASPADYELTVLNEALEALEQDRDRWKSRALLCERIIYSQAAHIKKYATCDFDLPPNFTFIQPAYLYASPTSVGGSPQPLPLDPNGAGTPNIDRHCHKRKHFDAGDGDGDASLSQQLIKKTATNSTMAFMRQQMGYAVYDSDSSNESPGMHIRQALSIPLEF